MRIAPDWVCEILSPSTADRDLGQKQWTYHRARVGHYWLVEPISQVLTVYRWQEAGYLLAMAWEPDARWLQGKDRDPLPRYTIELFPPG